MRVPILSLACASLAVIAGGAWGAACSTTSAAQQFQSSTGAGGNGGSPGDSLLFDASVPTGPPAADAGGFCGNQLHKIQFDAANVYFVLDRSGSMDTVVGTMTRFQHVHGAAVSVVEKLGPRINVGAAIFPLIEGAASDGCQIGGQVFPMTPGAAGSSTAKNFAAATNVNPAGGTPTAATLTALMPTIVAIPGRTIVVLATDGAPNCAAIMCDQSACSGNIEDPMQCPSSVNCCAVGGWQGPSGCVDRDAVVSALAAYKASGVQVAVVGIPGSQYYDDVLASMAIAGGAPQIAPPFYYKVSDLGNLAAVIGGIVGLVVSCDFVLTDPPTTQDDTNVYFDTTIVPQNDANGWVWTAKNEIELHGDACNELKSGTVGQVQIVSGCPTQVSK